MHPEIKHSIASLEYETEERCSILELANDPDDPQVSIARARVSPGVTTAWHKLDGVSERYLIVQGQGIVNIADLPETKVTVGDVVRIPSGVPQRIRNTGEGDLLFYAICSPRFYAGCYVALE